MKHPFHDPDFTPECPICEYNLTGLRGNRCPECGEEFDWDEVLDRSSEESYLGYHDSLPYLFWFPLVAGLASAFLAFFVLLFAGRLGIPRLIFVVFGIAIAISAFLFVFRGGKFVRVPKKAMRRWSTWLTFTSMNLGLALSVEIVVSTPALVMFWMILTHRFCRY